MNKKLKKQIKAYSALASTILAADKSEAQVVYVDLNPDSIVSNYLPQTLDFLDIDLNNDAVNDVRFIAARNSFSTSSIYYYAHFLRSVPLLSNEILGACYQSSCSTTNYTHWQPKRLNQGDTISPANWNDATETFLYRGATTATNQNFFGSGRFPPGTDKYVGLQFQISGQTHYAWIRVEVINKDEMRIKEYGYHTIPNTGLLAGDTTTVISGINPVNTPNQVDIFSNNQLIKINSPISLKNTSVYVYDLLGKEILQKQLEGKETTIKIEKKGIYFVEVKGEKGIFRKKIFIY